MSESATPENQARGRGERFLINVLWTWTGVAANLFVGLILSPYIIRHLGAERYGIWALIFSLLDYLWFFDLGFNTAVCNFCARFLAVKDNRKINETMNTTVAYFSLIAVFIWGLAPVVSTRAHRFFQVSIERQGEFSTLVLITMLSWGLCVILHPFVSALDGFQRFDLSSRVWVGTLVARSVGYALVLKLGYGLVQMAMVFVGMQLLYYTLNFLNFRRVFPHLKLSLRYARPAMFREIMRYGLRSFVASSSTLALGQSGPVLIGHYLPAAAVGFYALPSRLLEYAVDAVSRVALVTRSSAAELSVAGRREDTVALGIYANRYCLALFLPLAVFLAVYGHPLLIRWVGEAFAAHSAPLLPVFLACYTLVQAAQYNSGSLLFGLSKHGGYARGLTVEAVLYVSGLVWVVPRYGILGAACVAGACMALTRGVYTPWLVCRALDYPFLAFMRGIYVRPLATAVPVAALAWLLKTRWVAGNTWVELIMAGGVCALVYSALAFYTCVEPNHRTLLLRRIPILGPRLRDGRA